MDGWGKRSRSSLPHTSWPSIRYSMNLGGKKGFVLRGLIGEATSHHAAALFYVKATVSARMFHTCTESHQCPDTGRDSSKGRGGAEGTYSGPEEHQVHGWEPPLVFSSPLPLLLSLCSHTKHVWLQPGKDPSSGQMSRASQPDPWLCWAALRAGSRAGVLRQNHSSCTLPVVPPGRTRCSPDSMFPGSGSSLVCPNLAQICKAGPERGASMGSSWVGLFPDQCSWGKFILLSCCCPKVIKGTLGALAPI